MKINRYVIAISIIVLVVFIATNCTSKEHKKEMKTTHVDCEKGDSLADIVANSQKHTRIVVKGNTCQVDGSIIVTQDNIVIDGNGAVLDGQDTTDPVIIVKSNNVVLKDLTVTQGSDGIIIEKGATAVLKDVNANGNKGSGIVLGKPMRLPNPGENPNQIPGTKPPTLNDSTDNSLSGLFNDMLEKSSFDMSLVKEARAEADSEACQTCLLIASLYPINVDSTTFCGTVNVNDNEDSGIPIDSSGTLEICGDVNTGNTTDSGKQKYGIAVSDGSTINIYGLATARNNLYDGVLIRNTSTINLFGNGIKLRSIDNQGFNFNIGGYKTDTFSTEDESNIVCNATSKLNLTINDLDTIKGNSEKVGGNCFLP